VRAKHIPCSEDDINEISTIIIEFKDNFNSYYIDIQNYMEKLSIINTQLDDLEISSNKNRSIK
jgi:hypothetical protein